MTQNEVLVTLKKVIYDNQQFTTWTVSTPHIMELVRICIEKEREECARLCDESDRYRGDYFASKIRERGQV